jgi:uncharacterized membrane protein
LPAWIVLGLALVGFNVFAYQALLVPQVRDEQPAWHGAAWITTPGTQATVVYFRKDFFLQTLPNNAFLTVQGWQSDTLYVNGHQLDDTSAEVTSGAVNQANLYDLTPFLHAGQNSVVLRVVNGDQGAAAARMVIGVDNGTHLTTYPSDNSWLTTTDPTLVHPLNATGSQDWRTANYDDSGWQHAGAFTGATPRAGVLFTPSAVFETPLPQQWVTAGTGADAYFVQTFTPGAAREVWLRLAANGQAQFFVNGQEVVNQPLHLDHDAFNTTTPSQPLLSLGIYDLTPYLHAGTNTLAVHVTANVATTSQGTSQSAALLLDVVSVDGQGNAHQMVANESWHAAPTSSTGWTLGNHTASWGNALAAANPTPGQAPLKVFATNAELVNPWSAATVILVTTLLFLLLSGLALFGQMRWGDRRMTLHHAVRRLGLILTPVVALMLLLLVLNTEPLMPRPFPFTPLWLGVCVALALGMGVWLMVGQRQRALANVAFAPSRLADGRDAPPHLSARLDGRDESRPYRDRRTLDQVSAHPRWDGARHTISTRLPTIPFWLREALPVIALAVVGLIMATYQLGYESYWQDELTSLYAAKGVLQDGIPHMLSGFIYPKAELYSYLLALVVALFGTGAEATRLISVVEYATSIVLVYYIARTLISRRVGLLAMALLVFSPMELLWARETRMYQQAQLAALVVVFLFLRAIQPEARPRAIYLGMASVVLMYLSHEETFILLPALLIYFFATRKLDWVRNRHWWIAGLGAIGIICVQLLIVKYSHPPLLGTDHTMEPNIALNGANIDYYLRLLFDARALGQGNEAVLTVTSLLAVIACIRSVFTPDRVLRYLSLFFAVPLVCLMSLLTLVADRYIYVLLPIMAILAATTVFWLLDHVRSLARGVVSPNVARGIPAVAGALLIAAVLLAQTIGIANFGLATSRLLGLPYQHRYPDYQAAGTYIQAHWQPGDILITIAPALDGAYYAEQPSYLIYTDKALYFSDQDGHAGELATGAQALLNDQDVATVLASHHRIWLLAANGYACCSSPNMSLLQQNFALMFEGQATFVYLRSS